LLFLNKGRWNDVSVVPSQWTAESTKAYSHTDRKDRGYGYLWWTLDAGAWGTGAIFASGYGGQLIVIVPEKHLVAVQLVELDQGQPGIHSATFLDLVQQVLAKRRSLRLGRIVKQRQRPRCHGQRIRALHALRRRDVRPRAARASGRYLRGPMQPGRCSRLS